MPRREPGHAQRHPRDAPDGVVGPGEVAGRGPAPGRTRPGRSTARCRGAARRTAAPCRRTRRLTTRAPRERRLGDQSTGHARHPDPAARRLRAVRHAARPCQRTDRPCQRTERSDRPACPSVQAARGRAACFLVNTRAQPEPRPGAAPSAPQSGDDTVSNGWNVARTYPATGGCQATVAAGQRRHRWSRAGHEPPGRGGRPACRRRVLACRDEPGGRVARSSGRWPTSG